ncbi:bzip transcription factor family protein [Stylonychia lemnae]|uniref:Bzip transcription factor family protein n=1 Tax=Stylonychia lemnae TaxID=5949 RepID=A0A077ZR00_STYLE|nr:bzip transcription factor family protein [Stylonychia lemnae]|eukprot:CDW72333.1 bzip transcription factor family protein [Stylonychia lemnae]
MTHIFNNNEFQEDFMGLFDQNQTCLSPKKQDLELLNESQINFGNSIDFTGHQEFGINENQAPWEDANIAPTLISRGIFQSAYLIGNSYYEVPISKKFKLNNSAQIGSAGFGRVPRGAVLSSTQSDTSHNINSLSSKLSNQSSGKASSFKNDESLNNTSSVANEQSLTLESQILNTITEKTDSLTKTNKRIKKQESKQMLKKKQVLIQLLIINHREQAESKPELTKKQSKEQQAASNKKSQQVAAKEDKKNAKNKKQQQAISNSNSYDDSGDFDMSYEKLTNKKKEYLQEIIADRNGVFNYVKDPDEYKRARKRMQNRESAVRSRLRKRYYQDELEDKISDMEKIQKDLSEQNAGLAAQNALLKKQLQYFEDVFAKSSLLGFDQASPNVNRNDLEEFQRSLLRKINQRFLHERELEVVQEDDQLDMVNSSNSRDIDDLDIISTASLSKKNDLSSLRLARSRSNSSNFSNSGYLFLAIVFCVMCCSSFISNPSSLLKLSQQTNNLQKILPQMKGRSLLFDETISNKMNEKQSILASPLEDDQDEEMIEVQETEQIGAYEIIKMLLTGQYTYITYMVMSMTSFFFWMAPSFHKYSQFFKFTSNQNVTQTNTVRRSSKESFINRKYSTRQQAKISERISQI